MPLGLSAVGDLRGRCLWSPSIRPWQPLCSNILGPWTLYPEAVKLGNAGLAGLLLKGAGGYVGR